MLSLSAHIKSGPIIGLFGLDSEKALRRLQLLLISRSCKMIETLLAPHLKVSIHRYGVLLRLSRRESLFTDRPRKGGMIDTSIALLVLFPKLLIGIYVQALDGFRAPLRLAMDKKEIITLMLLSKGTCAQTPTPN
jgi:hypothetical protein